MIKKIYIAGPLFNIHEKKYLEEIADVLESNDYDCFLPHRDQTGIDPEELKFVPQEGQNDRSNAHIGEKEFDKELHKKHLAHIDINNLKGMEIEFIYEWKLGETLIVDRTHIHCASSRINNKKLGLTTFTKR